MTRGPSSAPVLGVPLRPGPPHSLPAAALDARLLMPPVLPGASLFCPPQPAGGPAQDARGSCRSRRLPRLPPLRRPSGSPRASLFFTSSQAGCKSERERAGRPRGHPPSPGPGPSENATPSFPRPHPTGRGSWPRGRTQLRPVRPAVASSRPFPGPPAQAPQSRPARWNSPSGAHLPEAGWGTGRGQARAGVGGNSPPPLPSRLPSPLISQRLLARGPEGLGDGQRRCVGGWGPAGAPRSYPISTPHTGEGRWVPISRA